jgi:hypothetical protein
VVLVRGRCCTVATQPRLQLRIFKTVGHLPELRLRSFETIAGGIQRRAITESLGYLLGCGALGSSCLLPICPAPPDEDPVPQ